MRLTAVFLLGFALHIHARGYSQTVTLSFKDAPLSKVFTAIQKETGYSFTYFMEDVELYRASFSVQNVSIEEVLQACLKGIPLTFTIVKEVKNVSIRKDERRGGALFNEFGTGSTIQVKVTNELGEPLSGASVMIRGTKKGTLTDERGIGELNDVSGDEVLMVSFSGYQSKEIGVKGKSALTISLAVATGMLDQVEVVAYGTTNQRFSTGDVTTVTAKEIEEQPVNNPLLALEGRVPGMIVTQGSGFSGTAVNVVIQGVNSMLNGNDPFYVVDGVPYLQEMLPNNSNVLGLTSTTGQQISYGSPLSYLNPSDIESISVLKDADATAIYGSRASNGAIIITTKKGKVGQLKVSLNVQQGYGEVGDRLNLMNTKQYLEMRHEALNNDGVTPSLTNGDYDLLLWDTTRYTNWQKVLIGKAAQYTNVDATVSGGSNIVQYAIGATYHRETTVVPGNLADEKGSVHVSLNSASVNQRFKIQFTANYMSDNNSLPQVDLTQTAVQLAPDAPALYNNDGTVNWAPNAAGASTWPASANRDNPIAYNLGQYVGKTNNLISNVNASYQLLPGLEVKSNFGYTYMQMNATATVPLNSFPPQERPYYQSTSGFNYNNTNSWIIEPQAVYKRTLGDGRLDGLVGMTAEQNSSNGESFASTGFVSDQLLLDPQAAAATYAEGTEMSIYKYDALFGRLNYTWRDKYLINLTARRDGSSRFGPQSQFHDFGAIGLGWIFNKEKLVATYFPSLSFGKIRASYGSTGSDQIGDYQFINSYSAISGVQVPYQGVVGLNVAGAFNPYLQWELTKKMQLGLDLGFFKDRILLNGTYFRNRSSNELLSYNLPITAGFGSIMENFPAILQNSGGEFSVHTVNIRSRLFNWSSSFNLTIPRNKLVAFPDLSTSSYANNYVVGQSITIVKTFHSLGVNDTTGIYTFMSVEGGSTSAPSYPSDYTKLIRIDPKFYGGLQNYIQYKGITLDVLLQFTSQIAHNYYYGVELPGVEGYNEPEWSLNRWQSPGNVKPIQKYASRYSHSTYVAYALQTISDAGYSNASYIRLKNLSLSWQLPNYIVKQIAIKSARVYIQGQNLLTITGYKGLDPETRNSTSLPPLKVLTFGLQLDL